MNDSAYTLHIEPANKKRKGRFRKGNMPWNKGLSWKEQGMSKELQEKIKLALKKSARTRIRSHTPTHSKPVIQMDKDGNRLHWYESSDAAARKLGLHSSNIRKVCRGERKHTGGFRWCWDDRFL